MGVIPPSHACLHLPGDSALDQGSRVAIVTSQMRGGGGERMAPEGTILDVPRAQIRCMFEMAGAHPTEPRRRVGRGCATFHKSYNTMHVSRSENDSKRILSYKHPSVIHFNKHLGFFCVPGYS